LVDKYSQICFLEVFVTLGASKLRNEEKQGPDVSWHICLGGKTARDRYVQQE